MSQTSKQEREREFHNKTFAEATRKKVGAAYSIVRDCRRALERTLLSDCAGKQVLEYGCGAGTYSFELAERGADVTGIDISDVAIAQASEQARERGLAIRYLRMDAERLEFPEAAFDMVCGVAILHHLDLSLALSGLARVLKPEGRAVFMEPLGHNPAINAFRRWTPSLRTPDEHPLLMKDLRLAERYFDRVDISYFNLTTLLAVPLRRSTWLNPGLDALNGLDRALFRWCPPVRRFAWQVIIELGGPKAQAEGRG